jgi:hypothetical protein
VFTACVDVGKPGANLGWAAVDGQSKTDGTDLDDLITAIAQALRTGPASLGFECPLFLPLRDDPLKMTSARAGESGPGLAPRPFSAGPGPTVTVLGTLVACYVLTRLRPLAPHAQVHMDWRIPPTEPGQLLIWEAFVTNQRKAHDTRHVEDARLAVDAYLTRMVDPRICTSSVVEPNCFSLIGAALLRTGWATSAHVLAEPCLVIRV